MMNRITLSINTEAPYSEDEKDGLLGEFVEWIQSKDGDVDPDSGDISVAVDGVAESTNSEDEIREAAAGLIANGSIEVYIRVLDIDSKVISKATLSTDD